MADTAEAVDTTYPPDTVRTAQTAGAVAGAVAGTAVDTAVDTASTANIPSAAVKMVCKTGSMEAADTTEAAAGRAAAEAESHMEGSGSSQGRRIWSHSCCARSRTFRARTGSSYGR
jgi:hypothetical protein